MTTITLPRNVQFLYEEHLARTEFAALGCGDIARDGDHWARVTVNANGSRDALLQRSAYAGTVDGVQSVYQQLIRPAYQGGRFNRTRSVNQYLTHWIYPYRGKFHPQMVRALFNLMGVRAGSQVAEPFMGSGTAAVEASLLGADIVGVDLSPLCVVLTRVKALAWRKAAEIRDAVEQIRAQPQLAPDDVHIGDFREPLVRDFLTVARLVSESDAARRKRELAKWYRKNLEAMLVSVDAFATAVQEFGIAPGRVDVSLGDARCLGLAGIPPNSVDAIVTSPPYSIALDYVKNDEHALAVLGLDLEALRDRMTGVRGTSARDKLALYNADMQEVFRQVATVLKPGGQAAFVVGDATVDGREYTTVDTMITWAYDAGLTLVRDIPKIVFGLYSVMQDERILLLKKED